MNQEKQLQVKENEISLIDIFLFIKASIGNVIKCTLGCLLACGAYYFSVPNVFEASATIEMATIEGEPVEAPSVLIEKMKLPLYFSTATLQSCGLDGELSSQSKFVEKIKPSINKSAPFVSFVTQAQSTQDAKACLNAAIAEVSSKQDEIAKPLLVQKKQKIERLKEQLVINEEIFKTFTASKAKNNTTDSPCTLRSITSPPSAIEINNLRAQIIDLENNLSLTNTRPVTLVGSVYAPDVPVAKRPFFTFGLALALGVFTGLFITLVMQVLLDIRKQIGEINVNQSS